MSRSMTQHLTALEPAAFSTQWRALCHEHDLVSDSGVVAWLDGAQVALFYLPNAQGKTLYALDNRDPKSGANVIGRGLIGTIKGELVIASPLYKQHFRLKDGSCLEYPEQSLRVWPVRLEGQQVLIQVGGETGTCSSPA